MLYGWRNMEERMLEAATGVSGYAEWEAICKAFYAYTTQNSGVFSAMLWYNKYQDDETQKVTASLGISEENCNHLIRTFRAFLEGFCLLANNDSFGHALSVEDSFNLSLQVLIAGMKKLGQ